jgi:hypothetical protein
MKRWFAAVLLMAMAGWVGAETIGLRFVVSDELGPDQARRQAVLTRLEKDTAELNGYYRNSAVNLNAEIVDVAFATIAAREVMAVLEDMERERGGFAGLFERADEFGADYTVAVLDKLLIRGKRGCGRAYAVNRTLAAISSTRAAFAAVDFACGAHTLAHELGHTMGLNHGSRVDACEPGKGHASAIAPHANGYAAGNCDGEPQPGEFGDIMVGGWMKAINGNGKSNLPMYSNPRVHDARCGAAGKCGAPETGDAARALNEHASYYAAHEEPDVHTLRYASAELRDCILRKYRGREIAELEELLCPDMGIADTAGLERLTALRRVDLSGNRLGEVAALEKLPAGGIERLDLRGNPRIPCAALKRLATQFPGRVAASATCLAD